MHVQRPGERRLGQASYERVKDHWGRLGASIMLIQYAGTTHRKHCAKCFAFGILVTLCFERTVHGLQSTRPSQSCHVHGFRWHIVASCSVQCTLTHGGSCYFVMPLAWLCEECAGPFLCISFGDRTTASFQQQQLTTQVHRCDLLPSMHDNHPASAFWLLQLQQGHVPPPGCEMQEIGRQVHWKERDREAGREG